MKAKTHSHTHTAQHNATHTHTHTLSLSCVRSTDMHNRQSIGSPSSKHHINGRIRDDTPHASEDNKKNDHAASSSFSSLAVHNDEDKERLKSTTTDQRLVHLIPLLTFLCFLVLFLSSHNPSQLELSQIKRPSKEIVVSEMNEIERVVESSSRKGEVVAIRSLRNLKEEIDRKASHYRIHRKIGYF